MTEWREMTPDDVELVDAARTVIKHRFVDKRHQIGAAVRTRSGAISVGVHLEAAVGRASICAEAVAFGAAVTAGDRDIVAFVAVRHPKASEPDDDPRVVPPCGLCRELLLDHAPEARAVLPIDGQLVTVGVSDLLPAKYLGTKWAHT